MYNPFAEILERISDVETLVLDIKNQQKQSPPIEQRESLLTVQEAAEFLNLSVQTIYSKVSKGELPVMKRSKRLYFSSTELIEYLKEGRKKSNVEIEQEAETYLSNNKRVK